MKKGFNKTVIEIGLFLLVFIIILVVAFVILEKTGHSPFVNKENKTQDVSNDEIEIKKEITTYLANNEKPNEVGGNCFASLKNYGFDEEDSNILYVQYYVQCYNLGDKVINTLNGYTIPAKVVMEELDNGYKVKEVIKPGSTNNNTLFPIKISAELAQAKEDGTIQTLKDSVDKQATDYYGNLKIVE